MAAASFVQMQSQMDRDVELLSDYFDEKQAEADRQVGSCSLFIMY